MKLQFLLALVLLPLISKCQDTEDLMNVGTFREGVAPYCHEECPAGYEFIPELGHCYRLLLELGPTSQDRGVDACGFAQGMLLSLDNKHDEDIIRKYFWDKYSEQMLAHPNYLENAGFWTAYMRMALPPGANATKGMFVNMYSGDLMNKQVWRTGGHRNERYDQACVARKWFYREFLGGEDTWETHGNKKNGLDDYVCAFPHWIICQVRKEYALNKRAHNVALMQDIAYGVTSTLHGETECNEKWEQQTAKQFDIMLENAAERGNQKALNKFAIAQHNIKEPTFEIATGQKLAPLPF